MYSNGKMVHKSIHRLVAEAFIPNPKGLPIVNHRDENKSNNNVDNLEWVTITENTNFGTSLKRRANNQKLSMSTRKPVVQYNENMKKINEYTSVREASRQTGCAFSHITEACKKI